MKQSVHTSHEATTRQEAANDSALARQAVTNKKPMLHNYLDETRPCPPIAQMVANMALAAKTKGELLLVSEIRYAIAGNPTMINDEYIYWDTCVEIGSTGKLGEVPEEYEINPGPKLLLQQSVCFVEHIKDPTKAAGKKSK